MFREMRRFRQKLSAEECIELLKGSPRGVLAVLGDEDYPYAVPMDFWYCEEDGRLYFHTAKSGHKIDAMHRHEKASFCIYDSGFRREGEWSLNIRSVIVFGRIVFVEDNALTEKILRGLGDKFTDDSEYVEREIRDSLPHVQCFALVPEHISGKLVNES